MSPNLYTWPVAKFCLAAAALGWCGCAEVPRTVSLPAVRPSTNSSKALRCTSCGVLIVYTPTEETRIFPDTMFAPLTGYTIYDRSGAVVRIVRNHLGAWDESPDAVPLPTGRYTVAAQSESGIDLRVPVIVKASKTTVVNLQWRDRDLVQR